MELTDSEVRAWRRNALTTDSSNAPASDRILDLANALLKARAERDQLRAAHEETSRTLKDIGALSQELGVEIDADVGDSISEKAIAHIRQLRAAVLVVHNSIELYDGTVCEVCGTPWPCDIAKLAGASK